MSEPITVKMAIGDLDVVIHDSGRASVRSTGDSERNKVGKFNYRINLAFLLMPSGDWSLDKTYRSTDIYTTEGSGSDYFKAPAPTIRKKIEDAAKLALLLALKDNPLSPAKAQVSKAWSSMERALKDVQDANRALTEAKAILDQKRNEYVEALDAEKLAEALQVTAG